MTPKYRETAYSKKLRDPRWQKMRLGVMNRDEFTCQICGNAEETLNVHHNYYKRGREPWDYPLESMVTLCETCHREETEERALEEKALLDLLRLKGLHYSDVDGLMYAFSLAVPDQPIVNDSWISDVIWAIGNIELLRPTIEAERAKRRNALDGGGEQQ